MTKEPVFSEDIKADEDGAESSIAESVQNELSISVNAIQNNPASTSSQPWLITFTDIMALMLTFFVLLFSMSVPDEGVFEKMRPEQRDMGKFFGHRFFAGDEEFISIASLPDQKGLDLGYLSSLIMQMAADNDAVSGIQVIRNVDRLILALPETVQFSPGSDRLSGNAQRVIMSLAGVLSRLNNQILVVGHADPSGGTNPEDYWVNWDISVRRAQAVAMVLSQAGVNQNIIIRGLSQARYNELPQSLGEEERRKIARRVDIIVLESDAEGIE